MLLPPLPPLAAEAPCQLPPPWREQQQQQVLPPQQPQRWQKERKNKARKNKKKQQQLRLQWSQNWSTRPRLTAWQVSQCQKRSRRLRRQR